MTLKWPRKDPADIADYQINWEQLLGADTIATSAWTVTGGLVIDSQSHTTTSTTVWLSGGTVGLQRITNRITTAGGRTLERTVEMEVRQL